MMNEHYDEIRNEIVELLQAVRAASARSVNALMTATFWGTGRRVVESEEGGQERAECGEALIKQLASDLESRFGRGFGWRNLTQMRAFYLARPASKILQTPSAKSAPIDKLAKQFQLPWSAYVRLLSVKRPEARAFYETETLRSGWPIRQLNRQIGSQFYERFALSRSNAAMLEKAEVPKSGEALSPEEAMNDPFVLEFLGFKDEYSETELEEGLIQHLADFLLEPGDDFAFLGRLKRLRIDDTWFRIDLLFFHRRLRYLVVIDLKVGRFSYADAGQMHLYLNYAREHWTKEGENPPAALILCAEKDTAEAHYALDNLPNKVLATEYQTVFPHEKVIAEELRRSRRQLEERTRGIAHVDGSES